MKIFKIATIVIFGTLLSFTGYSQKLTASFSMGYGSGLAKNDFDFNRTRTTNVDDRESVKYSLGKGLQLNGSMGYILNENMEAELGISYLMGGKTESVQTDLRDPASITTDTHTISAKALSFAPGLVFKSKAAGSLQPYAKLGIVLSLPSITDEYHSQDTGGPDVWHEVWKYKGGMATGFTSAVGATYKMGSFDLFGELYVTSLSYAPKEGEMTESSFNGTNLLPNRDVIDKQVQFVDSYNRQTNIPNTSPNPVLKTYYPLSNWGLKVGVKFNF